MTDRRGDTAPAATDAEAGLLPPCGGRYTAGAFCRAASLVEALTVHQCHPAFYAQRHEVAEGLRRMAARPDDEAHRAALNALRLFVFVDV